MADLPQNAIEESSPPEEEEPEARRKRRVFLKLGSLYLDPNNYRFIHSEHYEGVVEGSKLFSAQVQARTRRLLLGEGQGQVRDLLDSFRQNGWLDIEPIHVRQVEGRYLVVEGNRRVAALKFLQEQHQSGAGELGNLSAEIFDNVPVLKVADVDPYHHLIVMGLQHVSGKQKWPALNQAKLMRDLQQQHNKSPEEICRSLGIRKQEFNLYVRTLALCEAYQRSDYGDEFTAEKFNLFREVLKAPKLKEWLVWDDQSLRAQNSQNQELLFSWFSRPLADDDTLTEEERESVRASVARDPVVTTGTQVRDLAKIIEDPEAVKLLEETRNLVSASLSSGIIAKGEVDAAQQRVDQAINVLFARAGLLGMQERSRIESFVDRLSAVLIASGQRQTRLSQTPWSAYNDLRHAHFGDVCVEQYRGLANVTLAKLRPINLFAGANNAGKTSLLEAVYLLARQSDSKALLDVLCKRARLPELQNVEQLIVLLPNEARIRGCFDNYETALSIEKQTEPDDEQMDRATFVCQVSMQSRYDSRAQNSTTILRRDLTPIIRTTGESRILCPAYLTSPFLLDRRRLEEAHDASVRLGKKDRIVDFLRSTFSAQLQTIDRVDGFTSGFAIREKGREAALDLAAYGDGMQRAFYLAMLFALVEGGVLFLDEFENAIHARALHPLAKLLSQLATEFRVQVFLSTHSAEAIDAWTQPDLMNQVAGYGLRRSEGGAIEAVRFDGERLHRLREAIGFDLRGLS